MVVYTYRERKRSSSLCSTCKMRGHRIVCGQRMMRQRASTRAMSFEPALKICSNNRWKNFSKVSFTVVLYGDLSSERTFKNVLRESLSILYGEFDFIGKFDVKYSELSRWLTLETLLRSPPSHHVQSVAGEIQK